MGVEEELACQEEVVPPPIFSVELNADELCDVAALELDDSLEVNELTAIDEELLSSDEEVIEDWLAGGVITTDELAEEAGAGCWLLLPPLPPPQAVMERASAAMLKNLPKWAKLNKGIPLICNPLSLCFVRGFYPKDRMPETRSILWRVLTYRY
ncbi:hypothetical protein C4F51_05745 [Cellvibrio sp. KB43]|uniref:Uncharacterized protein n=2 Tax=Cellvibrio polysaccharolyticus TaxID=2082724 RepID=A0A928V3T1_9GAMM|nr:hypothetical protein [Cellvibrio polysaccharolyticus]